MSPLLYFDPRPVGLVLGLAPGAVLVYAFHRSGLTAMLTAAVVGALLPTAVLSGLHLAWAPATFAASASLPAAVLLLGAWGLSRPVAVDADGGRPPAFVRRLRAKRALRYEMNLLAQMQHGLLPRAMPRAGGYEVAVHSAAAGAGGNLYDVREDDAGRLWILTADVAGQGYSRAVAQAMIKAVLVSSMDGSGEGSGRLPSAVLRETRRVLYRDGPACESAALALARVDRQTGRVTLSSAGSPPPLLLADGDVSSPAASGPPLTAAPPAELRDVELLLPPGGSLLFGSGTLFDATDWSGVPFGREQARATLLAAAAAPAATILAALLERWKSYTTLEEPPAGTTVVVLRRPTREELADDAAA
jgi:serine/threonine-protein kinase RsbW